MTLTIEAPHYEETRQRLQRDPIIIAMSIEILGAPTEIKASFAHDSGTPTFEFMQRANAEYARRGGTDGGHIGAVAEALLRNLAILEGTA
ncbi:hypothetical protein SEA_TNGUYEN7_85 [Mycobacterium phage TNguyen7]|nr:hypothetical protein SEA_IDLEANDCOVERT_84 [Mycobacterium phage Idleandcovert]AVR77495.1 hypothetical protein SEA_TNGUYEN7_85 [Mycobacterium phage TNguyen7]